MERLPITTRGVNSLAIYYKATGVRLFLKVEWLHASPHPIPELLSIRFPELLSIRFPEHA